MNYLKQVLGIQTKYKESRFEGLPNFIYHRYHLQMTELEGQPVIFISPKEETGPISILKKHIEKIQGSYPYPVVLLLSEITSRQKESFIKEKIPFIVENKQIYLPFMAIYLRQRCDAEPKDTKQLLPSAQMLFLSFIYHGAKELPTSVATKELHLTPTSISRASKQLESLQILKVKKRGVQKILYSEEDAKELFEKNQKNLFNPIKRIVYSTRDLIKDNFLESNLTALSQYTMVNGSTVKHYATSSIANIRSTNQLYDADSQVAIELWRYDPKRLSTNKMVDPLSLALSLQEEVDERTETAVEEMLEQLWRNING